VGRSPHRRAAAPVARGAGRAELARDLPDHRARRSIPRARPPASWGRCAPPTTRDPD
jgi:hypothetical protein